MAINPPAKNFVMRDPLKVHAVGDAVSDRMTRLWSEIDMSFCDATPNPTELEVVVAQRVAELDTIRAGIDKAIADMKQRYEMPPEMTDDQITMDWMVDTAKEIQLKRGVQLYSCLCMPREPVDWFADFVKGGVSADEKLVIGFIGCYIAHYEPDMLVNIHTRGKILNAIKAHAKRAFSKEDIIGVLKLKAANGADIHYLIRHLVSLRQLVPMWEAKSIRVQNVRVAADHVDGGAKKKIRIN